MVVFLRKCAVNISGAKCVMVLVWSSEIFRRFWCQQFEFSIWEVGYFSCKFKLELVKPGNGCIAMFLASTSSANCEAYFSRMNQSLDNGEYKNATHILGLGL